MAAVSVLVLGDLTYALAARETIQSVLDHTAFDVFLTCDARASAIFDTHPRLRINIVGEFVRDQLSAPFLEKFRALAWCLRESGAALIMHIDADAVLVRPMTDAMIDAALGACDVGMVEQTRIIGSAMGRAELFDHYRSVSLPFLGPALTPPDLEAFRFYNSGVILFRREGLQQFLDWAEQTRAAVAKAHTVGSHMIADQDYLQVWANQHAADRCADIDWSWNHCAHWDEDFPRAGARVAHLSNACLGPTPDAINQLNRLRAARPALPEAASDLTFVVVTYNSETFLGSCLDKACRFGQVIVVDNGSVDQSVVVAERRGVRLVRNQNNIGFAAAANTGAGLAETATICFLNPDCFVTRQAVDAAMQALDEDPRRLAVPNYLAWNGAVTKGRQSGYTPVKIMADLLETGGHWRLAQWLRSLAAIDDPSWHWPIGACLFVRRSIFAELGGFPAAYFCYMEDVAIGQKAEASGIPTFSLNCTVPHLGGHGAAISGDARAALLDVARLTYAKSQYGVAFVTMARGLRKLLGITRSIAARAALLTSAGRV